MDESSWPVSSCVLDTERRNRRKLEERQELSSLRLKEPFLGVQARKFLRDEIVAVPAAMRMEESSCPTG
jgi:hypothetical protein